VTETLPNGGRPYRSRSEERLNKGRVTARLGSGVDLTLMGPLELEIKTPMEGAYLAWLWGGGPRRPAVLGRATQGTGGRPRTPEKRAAGGFRKSVDWIDGIELFEPLDSVYYLDSFENERKQDDEIDKRSDARDGAGADGGGSRG